MTLAVWLSLMVILGPSYLHALDLPDYATAIDAKTKAIDQLTTHAVKKTLLTGTDGGGTLSASWHEGDICHLTIIIGMSNRRVTNSYYYDHGRLIFASSEQAFFGWDKDSQKLNQNKIAITFQDKYYFVDGKLTIWNTDRMGADLSRHDSNVSKENETVLQQSSVFVRAARQESNSVDVEAFIKSGTH
jgi:hypothetical protein